MTNHADHLQVTSIIFQAEASYAECCKGFIVHISLLQYKLNIDIVIIINIIYMYVTVDKLCIPMHSYKHMCRIWCKAS